jgi:hypothetical protein
MLDTSEARPFNKSWQVRIPELQRIGQQPVIPKEKE